MSEEKKPLSRRDLMRLSAIGAAAATGMAVLGGAIQSQKASASPRARAEWARRLRSRLSGAACTGESTPAQPKGPFYPIHEQLDTNNDLTRVEGRGGRARGQIIYIIGRVLDEACRPVGGALVEIWQACESGSYNHERDPNPAPRDPDFQYFGTTFSGTDGRYLFKTIIPGAYPADRNWIRPPHIHFRVAKRGYHELVTQMYFAGERLNSQDRILMSLPESERSAVVVPFDTAPSPQFEPDSKVGAFNIVLKAPRPR